MAKKYFTPEDKERKAGKWSDGFSTSKTGKIDKKNKPSKTDDLEFEDGTVMFIDSVAKCKSITGKVSFFAVKGGSLEVNGKKRV